MIPVPLPFLNPYATYLAGNTQAPMYPGGYPFMPAGYPYFPLQYPMGGGCPYCGNLRQPGFFPQQGMPVPGPMYQADRFMKMSDGDQFVYKQQLLQMKQQLGDQLKQIEEALSSFDKKEERI